MKMDASLQRQNLMLICLWFVLTGCNSGDQGFVDYSDTAAPDSAVGGLASSEASEDLQSNEEQSNEASDIVKQDPVEPASVVSVEAETLKPAASDTAIPKDQQSVVDQATTAVAGEQKDVAAADANDKSPLTTGQGASEVLPNGSDVEASSSDAEASGIQKASLVMSAAEISARESRSGNGAALSEVESTTDSGEPLEIKLLIPEKSFRPEKNSTAVRVSYDDIDLLKILNMEPVPVDAVNHFPAWLSGLDGMPIRIRGFMYPTFEATGLTGFTLARDNGICCFVRKPKIYDIIAVELAEGVTSDYIEGKPFDVEGIFRIQPEADETELYRLYRIEDARVLR